MKKFIVTYWLFTDLFWPAMPVLAMDDEPVQRPSIIAPWSITKQENQPPPFPADGINPSQQSSILLGRGPQLPDYAPNGLALKDSGDYDAYGQRGLMVTEWLHHDEQTSTAMVFFRNTRGLLKCTKNIEAINKELSILKKIEQGPQSSDTFLMASINRVARFLHIFPQNKLRCLITSQSSKVTFGQYTAKLTYEEKLCFMPLLFKQLIQAASFLHYVGIAHSNINPDNVCMFLDDYEKPELMLVNYSAVSFLFKSKGAEDVQHQVPRGSTFGYDSPESIVYPAVNLLKRDAWAIGMTLYTGFTGIPFYGFTLEKQKVVALSRNDYSKVLIDAYYFGRGQEEPIKLDVDSQLSFRSFGPQAIRLLISDPAYRPTPLAMLNMLTRSANQASSKTDTYLAETAFKS